MELPSLLQKRKGVRLAFFEECFLISGSISTHDIMLVIFSDGKMACLWNPASSRSLLSVQKLGHPYAVNSWSMYNKVGNKACQKFWPQREFSLPCRPIVGFCLCRYRVGDAAGCHFCKFVKKKTLFL